MVDTSIDVFVVELEKYLVLTCDFTSDSPIFVVSSTGSNSWDHKCSAASWYTDSSSVIKPQCFANLDTARHFGEVKKALRSAAMYRDSLGAKQPYRIQLLTESNTIETEECGPLTLNIKKKQGNITLPIATIQLPPCVPMMALKFESIISTKLYAANLELMRQRDDTLKNYQRIEPLVLEASKLHEKICNDLVLNFAKVLNNKKRKIRELTATNEELECKIKDLNQTQECGQYENAGKEVEGKKSIIMSSVKRSTSKPKRSLKSEVGMSRGKRIPSENLNLHFLSAMEGTNEITDKDLTASLDLPLSQQENSKNERIGTKRDRAEPGLQDIYPKPSYRYKLANTGWTSKNTDIDKTSLAGQDSQLKNSEPPSTEISGEANAIRTSNNVEIAPDSNVINPEICRPKIMFRKNAIFADSP